MSTLAWNESPAAKLHLPDLKDNTAIVTGTSAGIGKATARRLLENGARVFGLALEKGDLKDPGLTEIECDLSDSQAIHRAFEMIRSQVKCVDYIVNVAGKDPKYAIDSMTVAQWDDLVNLNLRAYYLVIQAALPLLLLGQGRSIVNVSSINYRLGLPGRAAYSATKAGILGLTTGLSRELGRDNIRVNTISPGWIFTERQIEEYFQGEDREKHLSYLERQQSLKLKISSEDIANHVVFYLSNVSRASTAHNCVVDGGWILE